MTTHGLFRNAGIAFLALAFSATADAALTDISTVPLNTYNAPSSTDVKPNIMLILDNSGSMAWTHMPDNSADPGSAVPFTYGFYGYRSSQCNGVYYNPSITYKPPVDSNGNSYANSNFTAAWNDGYNTSGGTTNLSTSFRAEGDSTNYAAYYYKYTGTQTTAAQKNYYVANSFVNECGTASGSGTATSGTTPGSGVFTRVTVGATSGAGSSDERTNFANWYSYYRTRILMMKTASGLAFKDVGDKFRVGFMTINSGGADFINIADFTAANKSTWYAALYGAAPSGSTPLRTALSQVGRMYAGEISSINGVTVTDPLQYSCQQNYAILSTDGFWNTGLGYKLNGSTEIGNEDAGRTPPYGDGSGLTQMSTSTLQSQTSLLQSSTSTLQTQTSTVQSQTSQLQSSTSTLQKSTAQLQKATSTNSGTTWSAWSNVTSCTWDNSGSSRTKCQYLAYTAPAGATSCTALAQGTGTSGTWTGPATNCTYTAWTPYANASSCSAAAQSSGPSYSGPATQCQTVVTSPFANAASCTATTTPNSSGQTTQCQYTPWSGWANATSTCTVVAQSTSGTYNPTARQCQYTVYTSPAPASSCTTAAQSTASPYTRLVATTCSYSAYSAWANAGSCTVVAQSTSSPYTVSVATNCQYTGWSTPSTVSSCTARAQSTAPNYTVGTAVQCSVTGGGTSDTLADVADYYYNTDLRNSDTSKGTGTCSGPIIAPSTTPNDLCTDNVPQYGRDTVTSQHMTTFTVGLGVRGRMVYSPTYWTDGSGDFWDVWKGSTANGSICSWQASGTCVWPIPGMANSSDGKIENVDDLWHAAVNGHGFYYNATDPDSLSAGLTSLLTTIINTPRPGTAAAAASSNPNISSSDNYVFSSSYKSVEWYGELIRQQIDATTGTLSAQQWSAMELLDAKTPSTRAIYTNVSGTLTAFLWGNLTSTQQAYFKAPYLTYTSSTSGLSQFCSAGGTCLSSTAQSNTTAATGGAAGENLVNFLRGDRTNETTFYRVRTHVLGDIVSSEARYVKTPMFNYSDAGYSTYKTAQSGRTGMVYVGANDGMLHAFDVSTGTETWAYIPSFVLPNLYQLADANYSTQHQFFVDGSPEVGDIYAGSWKTILVGGLNRGGKGYYALDITDPAHPSLLWEFTDTNMGYAYGNPRITKLGGTWVAIVTSGYNNADGMGHVYVLNANTGALIRDISTGVGSAGSPSGLARISAHVLSANTDNTVKAVYGGDMLGNLWRFDVNGDIGAAGYDAQLLVSFKDPSGSAQPITAKPTVSTVNGFPVIYVGTGAYLGTGDISSATTQSFYAVKDKLDSTTYGNPRTAANNFVAQILASTTCPSGAPIEVCTPGQTVRSISSCTAVDWGAKNGWYVDFLTGGERSSTDPALALGTLVFTTITPNAASASACGVLSGADTSASFAYAMDYQTGCSVAGSSGVVAASLGIGLATRPILGRLPDGTIIEIIRESGGSSSGGSDMGGTVVKKPPVNTSGGAAKRVSWRELVTE